MDENLTRPPRWAESLLRLFLSPDEAETVAGDLLEAYRDSILPSRGRLHANLWFIRQIPSYALRASSLSVRTIMLAGVILCIFSVIFSFRRFPALYAEMKSGPIPLVFPLFFIGFAAARWTQPRTSDRALALHLGTRWGLATGMLWTVAIYSGNFRLLPGFPLCAIAALACAFVCGAHGAIKSDRLHVGLPIGFWNGLVSGMILHFGLIVLGYILAFIPGLPGAEIPAMKAYTAMEYQTLNVGDVIGGATVFLFFLSVFSPVAGWLGGWAGLLIARTGR